MATLPRPNFWSRGRRGHRFPFAALLTLLFLASCSDSMVGPTGDPDAEPDAWIVFVSDRVSETDQDLVDIFRMNPDGSEVLNLTSHPTQTYSDLNLSPDHSTLLFRSTRTGCYEVWSLPLETLEALQLTGPGERCNTWPRWSPDGSMIAFTTSRNQLWEVYVMEADGSATRNVSNDGGVEGPVRDFAHGWTPDGRVVFFRSGPEPRTLVVNPDGTDLEPLFEDFDGYHYPHWSWDGSQATFLKEVDGVLQLHLMNGDRTDVRMVSGAAGPLVAGLGMRSPWSPDGERILASDSDNLYVMNADGTGLTQVTTAEGNTLFQGWSPDGTRIAFSSDRAGTWDIYVVNIDGTGLQRVTDGSGNDRNAVWVPRR